MKLAENASKVTEKTVNTLQSQVAATEGEKQKGKNESNDQFLPEVDQTELSEHQRQLVTAMLFAKSEEDVGCKDLELDMNVTTNEPVQKNYVSVPKPLYPEVKQDVEDLLNNEFMKESKSAKSSPVVCIRKKDETIRLCVDYRELNRRTVPHRHPIPRIQEALDSLETEALERKGKHHHHLELHGQKNIRLC